MHFYHRIYILLTIILFLFFTPSHISFASYVPGTGTSHPKVLGAMAKTRKNLIPLTITYNPTTAPTNPPLSAQDFLMARINEYRKSQGLNTVRTDSQTCAFAATRAAEIVHGFNHDGFNNRVKDNTLPYTSYSEVTENIAMTSNYQEVVTLWINSPGHAENMKKNTPFVCVEKNGNFYAYEGLRP